MNQSIIDKFINSIRKNKIGIMLIVMSSVLVSIGQLFWKLSQGTKISLVVIGFGLYGIGAILMILAFRHGSFSVIHPMISTSYIFALILGSIYLNEPINKYKILSITIIFLGIILIGGGDD